MNEIRECPLCHSNTVWDIVYQRQEGIDTVLWRVVCGDCDTRGPSCGGRYEAIKAWNTRADDWQWKYEDLADRHLRLATKNSDMVDDYVALKGEHAKLERKYAELWRLGVRFFNCLGEDSCEDYATARREFKDFFKNNPPKGD